VAWSPAATRPCRPGGGTPRRRGDRLVAIAARATVGLPAGGHHLHTLLTLADVPAGRGIDWAHRIKDLVDVHYPDAERIVLVQDNLNTHTPASLDETFGPAEARRLADRPELHYPPKHGSWLNMAEIELAVLANQCLDRRLADRVTLQREVAAWQATRNATGRGVDWRFTTEDARIKLKHLYPAIHD
jgi:hypothetical protein